MNKSKIYEQPHVLLWDDRGSQMRLEECHLSVPLFLGSGENKTPPHGIRH